MTPAATLLEALEPLRSDPVRAAVLLDVDGTLAPIVRHADDAHVPEATRGLLISIAGRYGVVGCISGRRAANARRVVSIGSMAYVGNHGAELLTPGATGVERDPELASWALRVSQFSTGVWTPELHRLRVRAEDKDTISAFHWRGAPDEQAAHEAVKGIARSAEEAGLGVHWGRKVLEVRPPVALDKGRGVRTLLRDAGMHSALYVGDDTTDLDAFRALRELVAEGSLRHSLSVGVRSDETPAAIADEADLMVDGPQGVRELLGALLD